MHNVPGTILALGIIVGGFTVTGDVGRLAARGMRMLEATDVPDDEAPIAVSAGPQPRTVPLRPAAAAGGAAIPPRTGPEAVDLTSVSAGTRVRVWLRQPEAAASGAAGCLVIDVVDPATGEALVSEAAPVAVPGVPAVAPAPPRRMVVRGAMGGTIARGGRLDLAPHGIAGTGGPESLGPVVALDISR